MKDPDMHSLSIGIIGATGYIATPYREEIRDTQSATITALCARRQDRLQKAAKEDSCSFVSENWEDVVHHPEVNLVLILTPDNLHYKPALATIEAGKDLFCEKPIGANSQEAFEMWQRVRESKCAHYVPFWTRYVPVFIRARQIVQEGTLGDIRSVVYRWHNPRPAAIPFTWRDDARLSSAGSIADVGSHAYDTVRWLINCEATRVLAHADTITPPKPDRGEIDLSEALEWGQQHTISESTEQRKATAFDYATLAWEFASGAVGTLVLSHAPVLRKGFSPELEIHGTQGSLAIDRIGSSVSLLIEGEDQIQTETIDDSGFGNRFMKHVFPSLQQQHEGQRGEHPGIDDGWRVQLFTDAAATSARRGNWVSIAELDPEDTSTR